MTIEVLPESLAAARLRLARNRPYLSAALWALSPRRTVGMQAQGAAGPIGVDRYFRLYFDPDGIAKWTVAELEGVLYHEVGHLLRAHAARGDAMLASSGLVGDVDLLWNVCGDLEINDDILAECVPLPKDACLPANFGLPDGLFAEEYWEKLVAQAQSKCDGACGKGDGQGHIHIGKATRDGACGSGATGGESRAWEDPTPGGGRSDGVSQTEGDLVRRKVAEDVQQHAKARGNVPAWLARWADTVLTPKVDWRRVLAALIRRACGDVSGLVDYSYRRPSRRQTAFPDVVLPALRAPEARVAVVVDTSGSMSERELAQALAEIGGVLAACGQRQGVTVLACDAAVHTTQRVFARHQVKLAGGGGTDMGVGLDAAGALKPLPHAIIVVTDGETPWPEGPPNGIPVIVALTQAKPGYAQPPTWAKIVVCCDEGRET